VRYRLFKQCPPQIFSSIFSGYILYLLRQACGISSSSSSSSIVSVVLCGVVVWPSTKNPYGRKKPYVGSVHTPGIEQQSDEGEQRAWAY